MSLIYCLPDDIISKVVVSLSDPRSPRGIRVLRLPVCRLLQHFFTVALGEIKCKDHKYVCDHCMLSFPKGIMKIDRRRDEYYCNNSCWYAAKAFRRAARMLADIYDDYDLIEVD